MKAAAGLHMSARASTAWLEAAMAEPGQPLPLTCVTRMMPQNCLLRRSARTGAALLEAGPP